MGSLYLHIPFCERKCIYCDFYSIENRAPMEGFLQALVREIELYAPYSEAERFTTVFFGGGTPSLLLPTQLEGILQQLHRVFRIDTDAEITLEANPGTIDAEKFQAYRSLGVNRLSIGVQSFDDRALAFLGRIHTADEARAAVHTARSAGFDNVNVDLIYALPGQNAGQWQATLDEALNLEPDHVSAYSLIVEDHTPLQRMVRSKLISPAPEETEAELYEQTMAFFEGRGFEHYEVSNYARPGFRCAHNMAYWTHQNYLGFGPSAHAFWREKDGRNGRRWANIANVRTYCDALLHDRLPLAMQEKLSAKDLVRERIFLSLRNGSLDFPLLRKEFGVTPTERQQDLALAMQEEGLVRPAEGRLLLTRKGFLVCDEIAERIIEL